MDLSDKKVLLVEDNEMNRMMASISFSDYSLEPEEACDGAEAVKTFTDKPEGYYDMIFMDIMMPVMDGIEATKAIRALDRPDAGYVPIIAMTAESDPDEIAKYTDYGFTEYIEKPMEMEELEAVLQKYLM